MVRKEGNMNYHQAACNICALHFPNCVCGTFSSFVSPVPFSDTVSCRQQEGFFRSFSMAPRRRYPSDRHDYHRQGDTLHVRLPKGYVELYCELKSALGLSHGKVMAWLMDGLSAKITVTIDAKRGRDEVVRNYTPSEREEESSSSRHGSGGQGSTQNALQAGDLAGIQAPQISDSNSMVQSQACILCGANDCQCITEQADCSWSPYLTGQPDCSWSPYLPGQPDCSWRPYLTGQSEYLSMEALPYRTTTVLLDEVLASREQHCLSPV